MGAAAVRLIGKTEPHRGKPLTGKPRDAIVNITVNGEAIPLDDRRRRIIAWLLSLSPEEMDKGALRIEIHCAGESVEVKTLIQASHKI